MNAKPAYGIGWTVVCTNCQRHADLPLVRPGVVSIGPVTGWTFPPALCPACSRPADAGSTP